MEGLLEDNDRKTNMIEDIRTELNKYSAENRMLRRQASTDSNTILKLRE